MKKWMILAAAGMVLTGCATSRDGIRLAGPGPSQGAMDQARDQLESSAKSTAAKEAAKGVLTADCKPGVLVIGTVGPFREMSDDELRKMYPKYSKETEKWHPGKSAYLSEDQFVALVAGWTSLETFSVPGVFNLRSPAVVPKSLLKAVKFPSTLGSFMVGSTGDLVVARSNEDSMAVVEKVLCRDDSADYAKCAAQYERGRFDANSGAELDGENLVKRNGTTIDVATFRKTASGQ